MAIKNINAEKLITTTLGTEATIDELFAVKDDETVKILPSSLFFTESQISDLQNYLINITNESIKNLSDVFSSMNPSDGQVLTFDTTNGWQAETPFPGVTDHTFLTSIGVNTHSQIDTHISDGTIHFTQASISITESQISDLQSYLLNITAESIGDLSDVIIGSPEARHVLVNNGGGGWTNRDLVELDISDLQEYLKLDQDTPQTIINGIPDFSLGLDTSHIQLDTSVTPSPLTPGLIEWNSDEDTADLHSNGVTYQLGQEISPLVKNQTGSTITNGTPVRFSGTLGASGRVLITPAIADGTIPSSYILGLTTEDISNGSDGHVTTFGKVRQIDTTGAPYGESWSDGDLLYVSPTIAGNLTNVPPEAPNPQIFMGVVILAHANNGSIFTRPSWRGKLTDLEDVNGVPLTTTGQIIVWDNTNSYFDFTSNISDFMSSGQQLAITKASISGEFLNSYDSVTGLFTSSTSSYDDLTDVPSTFPPSAHTHTFASLTSKPTTIGGYGITDFVSLGDLEWMQIGQQLAITKNLIVGQSLVSYDSVTGLFTSAQQSYTDLSNIPSDFTPSPHTHTFASLTSKPTTISGYGITDYNSLWDTRLGTKSTTDLSEGTNLYYTDARVKTHGDTLYEVLTAKGANNGYAPLDNSGKLPTTHLPALAISDTFVVSTEAAMLLLTAETGDVAVRTDENKSYILQGADPTLLTDWQELLTPTDAVQTVNGLNGTVVLDLAFTNGDLSITGGNSVDLDLRYSILGHTHTFASLTSKPTTIGGYGITDFVSLGDVEWMQVGQQLAVTKSLISGEFFTSYNSSTGLFTSAQASYTDLSNIPTSFTPSVHTHGSYDRLTSILSGANVFSDIVVTDGIVATIATRTMTLSDLGYTGATDANKYVHPNHTGDVTSVADGATTIVNKKVTLAKMADMATASIIGRNTATTGIPEILSAATVRTIINVSDGATVDQTTIVGLTGTKAQFNTELSDGSFMFIGDAPTSHTHTFASLTSKPTTIGGYGITDFNSLGDARWLGISAKAADSEKLDNLDSSQFLRSDVADTKTLGTLTFNDNVRIALGTGADATLRGTGTAIILSLKTQDFFIQDNNDTRFTFGRTTGDFTATGQLISSKAQNTGFVFESAHIFADVSSTVNTTGTTMIALATSTVGDNGYSMSALRRSTDASSDMVWRHHNNSSAGIETMRLTKEGDLTVIGTGVFQGTGNNSFVGNLGVGITTPGQKISVRESDVTQSFGVGVFEFRAVSNYGVTKSILLHRQDSNQVVINEDAVDLDFRIESVSQADMFKVDAGTNRIGIGTGTPVSTLNIYENNSNNNNTVGLTIEQDGTGDSHINFVLTGLKTWAMGLDNDAGDVFKISEGSTLGINDRLTIAIGGAATFSNTVTATNFILSSDERLKTNIRTVDKSKRLSVEWKNFELKSEEGQNRYGVIAQELELVHPEFVRTDDEGFKSVAYIDLLIAKNIELEDRLEALEAKMELILKSL